MLPRIIMETAPEDKKKAAKKAYQKEYQKEYRKKYDERRKIYLKKYMKEYRKKYQIKNAESIKIKKKNYETHRRKTDPIFRIKKSLRARLCKFFKSVSTKKTNKTLDMVGCTPEFLAKHLSSQFKKGMTLENHGYKGWHIDHIIPLSSAGNDPEEQKKCFHYTNLQPLWWYENLAKGDKILQ